MDPISALLDVGGKLIDKLLPDPAAKQAAQIQLLQMAQNGELAQLAANTDLAKGQLQVDQAEASNPSLFVSGWRPFVGWVCGSGLAYAFLIKPICSPFAVKFLGAALEPLPTETLLTLLMGMLGLGGMRTIEKLQGVAAK
jgi:hypothetical protein